MALRLLLACWLLLSNTVMAAMPETVRVKLFQSRGEIEDLRCGKFHWHRGQRLGQNAISGGALQVVFRENKPLRRQYEGRLLLSLDSRRRLHIVNQLPTRNYINSVVSSEHPTGWPLEALKAQAVLTQSRLLSDPKKLRNDTTQDELYQGASVIRPQVRQAVMSVWGKALFYHHQPVKPYYHATCGGHTSGVDYWHVPYVSAVTCGYCKPSPFWKPTVKLIPRLLFERKLGPVPYVVKQDSAGRPLVFSNGLSGYQEWLKLGQVFGWDKAPGTRFSFSVQSNQVQIESTGAGHGVGLCQWGAAEMAKQGKTHREILRYYFPKLQLGEY